MLLALDVGNSEIDYGLFDAGWRRVWHLPTDASRTADEYRLLMDGLLGESGIAAGRIQGAVISSVVPVLTPILVDACRDSFAIEPLVIGPGVRTGLAIRYNPPQSLGADRLANAVAATAEFGAPVVVFDAGTASTFTVVDAEGCLVGGAIAAGVGVAAEALAAAGARLTAVNLAEGPGPVIGRTTDESMRSGVLYGYAGLADGLLARIEAELDGRRPTVVATGGYGPTMAALTERIDAVRPSLTLDGLRLLWERNRESA